MPYQFLKQAEKGYEDSYNGVLEFLKKVEYNIVRKEIDELFNEDNLEE